MDKEDILSKALKSALDRFREDPRPEHEFYGTKLLSESRVLERSSQNGMFDSTEKILVFWLIKQSEKLHYITGIKFELFEVHKPNRDENIIFGPPMRYWPSKHPPERSLWCSWTRLTALESQITDHITFRLCACTQKTTRVWRRIAICCTVYTGRLLPTLKTSFVSFWVWQATFMTSSMKHLATWSKNFTQPMTLLHTRWWKSWERAETIKSATQKLTFFRVVGSHSSGSFSNFRRVLAKPRCHRFRFNAYRPGVSFASKHSVPTEKQSVFNEEALRFQQKGTPFSTEWHSVFNGGARALHLPAKHHDQLYWCVPWRLWEWYLQCRQHSRGPGKVSQTSHFEKVLRSNVLPRYYGNDEKVLENLFKDESSCS